MGKISDRNYFEEGKKTFDYSMPMGAPKVSAPMQPSADSSVLSGYIEELRKKKDAQLSDNMASISLDGQSPNRPLNDENVLPENGADAIQKAAAQLRFKFRGV